MTTEIREMTIDELDAVSGGKAIDVDLGLVAFSMSFTKDCNGYAVQFGNGPVITGSGCPK